MSVAISLYWGSSPHTRGARSSQSPDLTASRIIPAYAGSTTAYTIIKNMDSDHPRIRGEHDSIGVSGTLNRGSSPHTRGALCAQPRILRNSRIIPAYAGSTGGHLARPQSRRDHPRIRGEHL